MKSLTVPVSRFRLLIVLILLLLFIPAGVVADPSDTTVWATPVSMSDGPSDPAEVEAFLDYTVPANIAKFNVPGATIAVVKDGKLVFAKGYGYSDISNKTAVDGDTSRFRIGSITKLFTWTAVMQLVAEGKIDLDADVNMYLKDFQIPDTYPGQPVTMRHLMTHSAGFEDEYRHMMVQETGDLIPFSEYCAQNIPARVWPPGTVSSYSNYGTTLAAVIVEDVSGISYEEFIQSWILSPLGMEQTSIKEDLPPALAHNQSEGYAYGNSENDPAPDDIYVISPAGSISSTAPDMSRFLAAHMLDGTFKNATILPADTAQLMHARAFSNDPRVSGMCLGFYEQHLNGRRLIEHGGDTKLFHSLLVIIPEE
jgi:CubicO group peptidase (beta-lactamase class C family)